MSAHRREMVCAAASDPQNVSAIGSKSSPKEKKTGFAPPRFPGFCLSFYVVHEIQTRGATILFRDLFGIHLSPFYTKNYNTLPYKCKTHSHTGVKTFFGILGQYGRFFPFLGLFYRFLIFLPFTH